MPKKSMKKKIGKQGKSRDDSILFAFLATFLSIIGFIIALIAKKDDEYVMYYAKQSLVIFIIGMITGIIQTLFIWIPLIGWLISFALGVLVFAIWLLSWLYALSGDKKEIPIVSDFAKKIKI